MRGMSPFTYLRLLYEIYHTLVYKVNGVLVSDTYIKIQFDGIFNSKFMEYKISDFERNIQRKKQGIIKKDPHHVFRCGLILDPFSRIIPIETTIDPSPK